VCATRRGGHLRERNAPIHDAQACEHASDKVSVSVEPYVAIGESAAARIICHTS
jgi:hypothetical protein